MYLHSFLWGVAVTLLVATVALMIAEAWMKREIKKIEEENNAETLGE